MSHRWDSQDVNPGLRCPELCTATIRPHKPALPVGIIKSFVFQNSKFKNYLQIVMKITKEGCVSFTMASPSSLLFLHFFFVPPPHLLTPVASPFPPLVLSSPGCNLRLPSHNTATKQLYPPLHFFPLLIPSVFFLLSPCSLIVSTLICSPRVSFSSLPPGSPLLGCSLHFLSLSLPPFHSPPSAAFTNTTSPPPASPVSMPLFLC